MKATWGGSGSHATARLFSGLGHGIVERPYTMAVKTSGEQTSIRAESYVDQKRKGASFYSRTCPSPHFGSITRCVGTHPNIGVPDGSLSNPPPSRR